MRAIDADAMLARLEEWNTSDSMDRALYNFTMNRILEQPTFEPERKKCHWINIRHDNVAECDQCGITGRAWMNFCFDCGADMREDAEEPKKCDTCKHEKEPWSMQCHRCEDFNLWEEKQ